MNVVPLILGLVSSLHCVGMCGPIAIMIPNAIDGHDAAISRRIRNILLYNGGRTLTYMVYGAVFGLIGKSFSWFGWQQQISIALGVLIMIGLLITLFSKQKNNYFLNPVFSKIRNGFSILLGKKNASSLFGIGLLNGLLPCGMVYLALAGATASGTSVDGAVFMGLFGLGTIPAMASLSFFGSILKPSVRQYTRKLFPAMMFFMAILLIVRGMNLGIPFLSPELQTATSTPVSCH